VASTLRRGSRLGKYRLESRLGSGAFAEVWKATDTVVRQPVALKVVHESMVQEWGRNEIEHEARMASRLHHPNIVAVLNADWVDGRFVMASELARTHLGAYTRARRSPEVALRVMRDVAAGLAYAHSRKIMHRDVKPENILVFPDGRFALTDFGVARFAPPATRNFTDVGTLGYIAPEQAYGRPGLGSDVFSLGIIVYHLLTGVLPTWPFRWPLEGNVRFLKKVPAPLQPVLRKAAEFEPRRRYTSAVELERALGRAFAQVEAPRPRGAKRKRARKKTPAGSPLEVQEARHALPLPPLQRGDRRGYGGLPVVRHPGQLVPQRHPRTPRLPRVRARCAARVDRLPVVLPGPFRGQWARAAPRPEGGAALHAAWLPGRAARLHALLPGLQAEAEAPLEPPRALGSLPALPLARVARLLALLCLVRPARAPRRHVQAQRKPSLVSACVVAMHALSPGRGHGLVRAR